ncbi:MAG: transglutaminase family protein [Planctomycetota bacterium]
MTYLRIRHETRYEFEAPVREAVMEARLHPRDDIGQAVVQFDLRVTPKVRLTSFRDWAGNLVHHFDIARTHRKQEVVAESVVKIDPQEHLRELPDALPPETWDRYAHMLAVAENLEMTLPSEFALSTAKLEDLAEALGVCRARDPMTTVQRAASAVHEHFDYHPESTEVDSPIDDAIDARSGVCQDFAHILIALLRRLGVPARYVSGYLVPRGDDPGAAGGNGPAEASHAWVEALLPTLGWVGVDPTHDRWVVDGYVRTAVGRDYADVPPVRGVYRGSAESRMTVAVSVAEIDAPPASVAQAAPLGWVPPEPVEAAEQEDPLPFEYAAQQMQQQQR